MTDSIKKETVKHAAHLARLSLDGAELEEYSTQLAAILSYISKLNEADTRDTQPTSHPLGGLKNVFRADAPRPSFDSDEALLNAPARDGDFFRVPKVIEGK